METNRKYINKQLQKNPDVLPETITTYDLKAHIRIKKDLSYIFREEFKIFKTILNKIAMSKDRRHGEKTLETDSQKDRQTYNVNRQIPGSSGIESSSRDFRLRMSVICLSKPRGCNRGI